MKTTSLIKIASVLLLGLALSGNTQAKPDKFSRDSRPALARITHSVKLNLEDIRNMQFLLARTSAVNITWNNSELKFAMGEGDSTEYTVRFEAINTDPIEGWMFEPEYLTEETEMGVESWMLDESYLDEEVQSVESWMFDPSHLGEAISECALDIWMFDANYLSM